MNENQYNFNEQILNTLTVQRDGIVTGIRTAPQGGQYVKVGYVSRTGFLPTEYYVPSGYDTIVKAGQKLEAGDPLSTKR